MHPPRLAVLATLGTALAACGQTPSAPGPEARICAQLVAFYLRDPRPIELTGHETKPDRVRVDYRSSGQEGVALCQLRARVDGALEITDALVDENRLRDDEIAAFQAQRSPR